jgi:hypothetical protein
MMLKILTIHDQQDSIGVGKILTDTVSLFKKNCRSINVNIEIVPIFRNRARAMLLLVVVAMVSRCHTTHHCCGWACLPATSSSNGCRDVAMAHCYWESIIAFVLRKLRCPSLLVRPASSSPNVAMGMNHRSVATVNLKHRDPLSRHLFQYARKHLQHIDDDDSDDDSSNSPEEELPQEEPEEEVSSEVSSMYQLDTYKEKLYARHAHGR